MCVAFQFLLHKWPVNKEIDMRKFTSLEHQGQIKILHMRLMFHALSLESFVLLFPQNHTS